MRILTALMFVLALLAGTSPAQEAKVEYYGSKISSELQVRGKPIIGETIQLIEWWGGPVPIPHIVLVAGYGHWMDNVVCPAPIPVMLYVAPFYHIEWYGHMYIKIPFEGHLVGQSVNFQSFSSFRGNTDCQAMTFTNAARITIGLY